MDTQQVLPRTLTLSSDDNVLVAVEKIEKDVPVGRGVVARQRIPFGHKIASRDIPVRGRDVSGIERGV